jgi:hypothetical protein
MNVPNDKIEQMWKVGDEVLITTLMGRVAEVRIGSVWDHKGNRSEVALYKVECGGNVNVYNLGQYQLVRIPEPPEELTPPAVQAEVERNTEDVSEDRQDLGSDIDASTDMGGIEDR